MLKNARIEWPTVLLFAAAYALWAWAIFGLGAVAPWLAAAVAAVAIAFHSSLQHEAMHGHPTRWATLNTALAWPPLTLVIPYLRFRDTHLDHHRDATLTDPYDDPESHFLDRADWEMLPRPVRAVMLVQNTLAGRLAVGPAVGTLRFFAAEVRAARGDARVLRGWLWHMPALTAVIAVLALAPMPFWAYALAVYGALALLRIRTFIEHQAHEVARARSVIIEDRGPLALLFLNNNLHAVHHAHPQVAWYRLPSLYRQHRERFLKMNQGYRFGSYGEVFAAYLFHRKDPVEHPIFSRQRG